MRNLLLLLSTFLLSAAVYAQNTVVDIIVGSDDHTTLEAAILAAELDSTLATSGPFTVFAPTDDAFDDLPEGTVEALLEDGNRDSLVAILTYHVVMDSLTADSIVVDSMALDSSDTGGLMVATLQGDSIMVNVTISNGDTMIMLNGMATVTSSITASNGVVHVIDAVLMPPADTSTSVRREPAFAAGVSLAPNPTASELQVQLPESIAGRARLTLRDLTGRTILVRSGAGMREFLNVSDLPSGTYLLEVRSGREAIQRRVVVQR